jgi:glucose uptake protein
MNNGLLDYGIALITLLLFGSWAVPSKTLRVEAGANAFWLTVGHFILSIVLFTFVVQPIPLQDFVLSFIAGVLWGIGIFAGFYAIKQLGITRAQGIWVPVVVTVSALWGLLFFGEAYKMGTEKLVLSVVSIIILIIAALVVIFSMRVEKSHSKNPHIGSGILAATLLGIFHGTFFVPLHASKLSLFVTFVPLTLGMVTTSYLLARIQKTPLTYSWQAILRMISGGLILGTGNYMALLTVQILGVAQGYPLTQLGIVVNTLWGILLFKEVTSTKGRVLVLIGIVIALGGAFLLNVARL